MALAIVDAFAKFKEHGFIHCRNIEGRLKFQKGHVTQIMLFLEEIFTSGWDLSQLIHLPNLISVASSIPEIFKGD